MRVLKIAAGVILILTGVFCFATPGAMFASVAFLLGCAMLLSGIIGILAYIWMGKNKETSIILMAEGLTSVILGVLVLANQLQADAAIPVFFGLWVMFSGVIRAAEAYTHRDSGRMTLIWLSVLGVLGIAAGLYAFFNTVVFALPVVVLTGIMFIVQGVNVLLVGVNFSFHHKRALHGKPSLN